MRPNLPRATLLALTLGIAGVFSSGCDDGPPCNQNGTCAVGHACTSSGQCASRFCLEGDVAGPGTCGQSCVGGATCPEGLVCGTYANGQFCSRPCDPAGSSAQIGSAIEGPSGTCVGNAPTTCAQVASNPGANCANCYRSCGAGMLCGDDDTCEPLHAVGDQCSTDSDCASDNCAYAYATNAPKDVCLVGHGEACTTANCTLCATTTGGATFCHEECRGPSDCPTDFPECVGSSAENRYWCHRSCIVGLGGCPTGYTCRYTSDYSIEYCDPN